MLGWLSCPAARASVLTRSRTSESAVTSVASSFTATSRSSTSSRPSHTIDMPPCPSGRTNRYRPPSMSPRSIPSQFPPGRRLNPRPGSGQLCLSNAGRLDQLADQVEGLGELARGKEPIEDAGAGLGGDRPRPGPIVEQSRGGGREGRTVGGIVDEDP